MDKARRIFDENLAFATYMADKYRNTGVPFDDLKQIALLGLWKASLTYDEDRGSKFSTYAGRCIQNEINMHLRSHRRQKNEIPSDMLVETVVFSYEPELLENMFVDDLIERINLWLRSIPNNTRGRITKKFIKFCIEGRPATQHEIAQETKASQSYVSRVIRRAQRELKVMVVK